MNRKPVVEANYANSHNEGPAINLAMHALQQAF